MWPAEFFFGQALVVEHKTIVFPEQALNLVALAVGEGIEAPVEGVVAQFLFDNRGYGTGRSSAYRRTA